MTFARFYFIIFVSADGKLNIHVYFTLVSSAAAERGASGPRARQHVYNNYH